MDRKKDEEIKMHQSHGIHGDTNGGFIGNGNGDLMSSTLIVEGVRELKIDSNGKIIETPIVSDNRNNSWVNAQSTVKGNNNRNGNYSRLENSEKDIQTAQRVDQRKEYKVDHMKNAVDKIYGVDEENDRDYPNVGSAKMFRDVLLEQEKKQMEHELMVRQRRQLNIMKKLTKELEKDLERDVKQLEGFNEEVEKTIKLTEIEAKKRELELIKYQVEEQIKDDDEQMRRLDQLNAENQLSLLLKHNEEVLEMAEENLKTGIRQRKEQNDRKLKDSKQSASLIKKDSTINNDKDEISKDTKKVSNRVPHQRKWNQAGTQASKTQSNPSSFGKNSKSLNKTQPASSLKNKAQSGIKNPKNSKNQPEKDNIPTNNLATSQLSNTKQSFFFNSVIFEESIQNPSGEVQNDTIV